MNSPHNLMNAGAYSSVVNSVLIMIGVAIQDNDLMTLETLGVDKNTQAKLAQIDLKVISELAVRPKVGFINVSIDKTRFERVIDNILAKNLIFDFLKQGAENDMVAQVFGVHPSDCARYRRERGINISKFQRKPSDEQRNACVQVFEAFIKKKRLSAHTLIPGEHISAEEWLTLYNNVGKKYTGELNMKLLWVTVNDHVTELKRIHEIQTKEGRA